MAVDIDYIEIKTSNGESYLLYHCEVCKREHIENVDSKQLLQIRRACRVCDEVLLWCGIGVPPAQTLDFGMVQVITPRKHMTKKKRADFISMVKRLEHDSDTAISKYEHLKDEIDERIKKLKAIGDVPDDEVQNGKL